jgi:hypothetical protein
LLFCFPLDFKLSGLHDGEILARSDGNGKGATFIVEIPLLSEAEEKFDWCKKEVSAAVDASNDDVLRDKFCWLMTIAMVCNRSNFF